MNSHLVTDLCVSCKFPPLSLSLSSLSLSLSLSLVSFKKTIQQEKKSKKTNKQTNQTHSLISVSFYFLLFCGVSILVFASSSYGLTLL